LAVAETQPALNGQKVRELALPVPPVEEQHAIVRCVDQLLAASDALLARIDVAQRQVDLSSPAILAKAFRGELIQAGTPDKRGFVRPGDRSTSGLYTGAIVTVEQELAAWSATRAGWQQKVIRRLCAGESFDQVAISAIAQEIINHSTITVDPTHSSSLD
jgi:hypothetical protein